MWEEQALTKHHPCSEGFWVIQRYLCEELCWASLREANKTALAAVPLARCSPTWTHSLRILVYSVLEESWKKVLKFWQWLVLGTTGFWLFFFLIHTRIPYDVYKTIGEMQIKEERSHRITPSQRNWKESLKFSLLHQVCRCSLWQLFSCFLMGNTYFSVQTP